MLVRAEKPITKEQYCRAMVNHGYIDKVDMGTIFSDAERFGYGVYSAVARKRVNEETGEVEYYVEYDTGASCD